MQPTAEYQGAADTDGSARSSANAGSGDHDRSVHTGGRRLRDRRHRHRDGSRGRRSRRALSPRRGGVHSAGRRGASRPHAADRGLSRPSCNGRWRRARPLRRRRKTAVRSACCVVWRASASVGVRRIRPCRPPGRHRRRRLASRQSSRNRWLRPSRASRRRRPRRTTTPSVRRSRGRRLPNRVTGHGRLNSINTADRFPANSGIRMTNWRFPPSSAVRRTETIDLSQRGRDTRDCAVTI